MSQKKETIQPFNKGVIEERSGSWAVNVEPSILRVDPDRYRGDVYMFYITNVSKVRQYINVYVVSKTNNMNYSSVLPEYIEPGFTQVHTLTMKLDFLHDFDEENPLVKFYVNNSSFNLSVDSKKVEGSHKILMMVETVEEMDERYPFPYLPGPFKEAQTAQESKLDKQPATKPPKKSKSYIRRIVNSVFDGKKAEDKKSTKDN
ncbi:hypothetical protein M3Y96_00277000 [Aphelenchoides besseyi]|nr:hypothetical protein M3Y96_00277000 [Aphelenchoides besseyi]